MNQVTPSRVCELKFRVSVSLILDYVTPSRVCELKFKPYISGDNILAVTPSRVCELKSNTYISIYIDIINCDAFQIPLKWL